MLSKPLRHPSRARAASTTIRRLSSDRLAPRYRTLSAVAADVAAAAALAAQQNEQVDRRYSRPRQTSGSVEQHHDVSASHFSESIGDDTELDDNGVSALTESFHSDTGSIGRKRVLWGTERYSRRGSSAGRSPVLSRGALFPALQITTTQSPVGPTGTLDRGRTLQREMDSDDNADPEVAVDTARTSSRASRRGAGMVFLTTWALFGFGTLAGKKTDLLSGSVSMGKVLFAKSLPVHNLPVTTPESFLAMKSTSTPLTSTVEHLRFLNTNDHPRYDLPPNGDDIPPSHPSTERITGRIFAWLCTILYLTSRLPQIWKNVSVAPRFDRGWSL